MENKGDFILQLKGWINIVWLFLKNKDLIILVVVVAYYVYSTLRAVLDVFRVFMSLFSETEEVHITRLLYEYKTTIH